MHYYEFNVGDHAGRTAHLEPIEDLIYRRLLDLYYLTEKPLVDDVKSLARLIRMRTHCECIANILCEFFVLELDGWHCENVDVALFRFSEKSEKAANSARIRWQKQKAKKLELEQEKSRERRSSDEAKVVEKPTSNTAMRTHSECNANHKPLTINHKPTIKKNSTKKFEPPTLEDVKEYSKSRGDKIDPNKFFDYYEAGRWKDAKGVGVKNWKQKFISWEGRAKKTSTKTTDNLAGKDYGQGTDGFVVV